ncbi:MAG TPA: ATP-binding protein [bacterium]|nr:ATP-binding protein [bacterium]
MNFERIRISLIVVFFLVAIFPLSVLSRKILLQGENLIKEKTYAHLTDLAVGNANALNRFMRERANDIQAVSNMISKSKWDDNFIQEHLAIMENYYGVYLDIVMVSDKNHPKTMSGNDYSKNNELIRKIISEQPADRAVSISDVFLWGDSEKSVPAVIVCAVVERIETEKEHLCGTVDFSYINNILKESEIEGTGEVYVVNREGYFLTASRFGAQILEDKTPIDLNENPVLGYREELDYRGQKVLHVRKKAALYPWYIIAEQDKNETLAQTGKLMRETLFYISLITVSVMAMAFIVATLIVNILKSKYTYEKELEFQIIQKDKMVALGLMTAGLAHELNTPLANALLYVQIAREEIREKKSELLDKRLLTVEEEVKQGGKIVKNLLSFSHHSLESSKSANVNDKIENLLMIAGSHCESKGIKIEKDLEKDIPDVKADNSIVQEILTNIFANAIDSMPDGGTVKISTRYVSLLWKVRVEVSDSGPGIPRELLGKVFDPFFTTKKNGEGTGLGLFVCYQMVRRLGGDIKVISKSGGSDKTGTTFTVELPVYHENKEQNS